MKNYNNVVSFPVIKKTVEARHESVDVNELKARMHAVLDAMNERERPRPFNPWPWLVNAVLLLFILLLI